MIDNMPIQFKGTPSEHENLMDLVATHQRTLVAACLRTKGPILECGVGWYSTPILHSIAAAQGRDLLTVDNNSHWLKQFQGLNKAYDRHKFLLVGWWGEFYYDMTIDFPSDGWDVIFMDQGQPIEREYATRALINNGKIFVFHDTEEGFAYGYDRILPMFRYRWTDECQQSFTTIASNAVDIRNWVPNLPKCNPSTEVT